MAGLGEFTPTFPIRSIRRKTTKSAPDISRAVGKRANGVDSTSATIAWRLHDEPRHLSTNSSTHKFHPRQTTAPATHAGKCPLSIQFSRSPSLIISHFSQFIPPQSDINTYLTLPLPAAAVAKERLNMKFLLAAVNALRDAVENILGRTIVDCRTCLMFHAKEKRK